MGDLRASIERQWYGKPHWLLLLAPLVLLFIVLSSLRRLLLTRHAKKCAVPVVVVGNIAVGGTGKTPVIIALAKAFTAAGYKPGVIARGYGAKILTSQLLPDNAQPNRFGDEPVLIARATHCSVAVGPNRVESVALLNKQRGCDVILSDDGLQHYRLHRDIEIAVIDGARQLGNGWRLPVGPLREGKRRLQQVDFVLINGRNQCAQAPRDRSFQFTLQPIAWCNVLTGERIAIDELSVKNAVAFAGIGNPGRFFDTLAALGFDGRCRAFADHHAFSQNDFRDCNAALILMTEKDAVKCRAFAEPNWWALSVEAQLPDEFLQRFLNALSKQSS